MKKYHRYILIASSLLLLALVGCNHDSDAMQTPIEVSNEEQLTLTLLDLKHNLPEQDYQSLVEAVATLRTFDLQSLTIEKYFSSLSGKTPIQIIARADQVKKEFDRSNQ